MDLKTKKENYQKELNDIEQNLASIREQIANLDQQGQQLVVQGNIILGKIQVLEELEQEECKDE